MLKTKIEIIYQDDDIIVINKPSGISVTADRSGEPELVDILVEQLAEQMRSDLRLVHRLDKDTSGVMILAKNTESQSKLSSYFSKKLVKKTYLALVSGVVMGQQGRIDKPLARSSRNPSLMCVARKKGKEAVTEWRLVADFGTVSLLAVSPMTGRTHQIRVHLTSVGLALAIDPLYGNSQGLFLSDFKEGYRLGKDKIEKQLIDRLTLHSYQIELPYTQDNHSDCFIAGLDKKFTAALKMLTKHNAKGLDSFTKPDDFSTIINTKKLY
ncbi:MAG: RluA family pseudouridine synthase [Planctomycetota bacterium]|jgi:RluA family pseudouridine synthase